MDIDSVLPTLMIAVLSVALLGLLLWSTTSAIGRAAARMEGVLEGHAEWATRLRRFARRMFSVIVLLAASVVLMRGLGVRGVPQLSSEEVVGWVMGPGLRLVVIAASVYLVTRALHFLIESLQMLLLARDASQIDLLERRKRVDTLGQLLRVVVTLLVGGVGVLTALSLFNVDIRPILTGAGIAGLAVGFGAQNLVRDIIAGFFLILEDQVRLGDVVEINGKSGLVEAIRLRTIVLRGMDGVVHVIPNGGITGLSNMTKDYSYAVLDVGVGYRENPDEVMAALREIGAELQRDAVFGPSMLEPLEVLGVEGFGNLAVDIKLRVKTVPTQQWNVARELRRRIKIDFARRGIDLPHPAPPPVAPPAASAAATPADAARAASP
jgi:small conductance mechanosensitive channel